MKIDQYVPDDREIKGPNGNLHFNSTQASWVFGEPMMKVNDFLKSLLSYSLGLISERMCDLLVPYLNMLGFMPQSATSSSNAAAGLCS